jgi:hypothetical protein
VRWLLVLIACAGCRQLLGIEDGEVRQDALLPADDMVAPDTPIANGHDEDTDGIADTTDNCPTLENTNQAATPSDELVGAACDPRSGPAAGGDRIGAFFSFEQPMRPNGLMGGETFSMDQARLSGGELATMMQFIATRVSVIVSDTTIPVGASTFVDLRFGNFSCRVGPCAGSGTHCLTATGTLSTGETDVVVASSFRLELDQIGTKLQCRFVTAQDTVGAEADITGPDNERVRLRVQNVDVRLDSFIVYVAP